MIFNLHKFYTNNTVILFGIFANECIHIIHTKPVKTTMFVMAYTSNNQSSDKIQNIFCHHVRSILTTKITAELSYSTITV